MSMLKKLFEWTKKNDGIFLDEYIENLDAVRKAQWEKSPVPHLIIDNFFTKKYAEELSSETDAILTKAEPSETRARDRFSRIGGYDAYSFHPEISLTGPFRVFYSREWYELFKNLSGFALDENIMSVLHHHKINSESGWVHNDYGKFAFKNAPMSNLLNQWNFNSIYQGGGKHGNLIDIEHQESVSFTRRSIALIYYMGKDTWREGDGGETAFFDASGKTLVKRVEPINNRLLAFQISPLSYHAYQTNRIKLRNSVAQWFHEPMEVMDSRLQILK